MKKIDKKYAEIMRQADNAVGRKELDVPPRVKPIELPIFDKESVQKKVRSTLYKYPIIPFLFYGVAILILIGGLFYVFKSFNIA